MTNGNGDWGDDIIEAPVDTEMPAEPLPKFLADLRDGTAPKPPEAGMARARRLEQMQKDIVALNDFLNDLDRYAEHAKGAQLVGTDVARFMEEFLKDTRGRCSKKARRIYEEYNYLKEHP